MITCNDKMFKFSPFWALKFKSFVLLFVPFINFSMKVKKEPYPFQTPDFQAKLQNIKWTSPSFYRGLFGQSSGCEIGLLSNLSRTFHSTHFVRQSICFRQHETWNSGEIIHLCCFCLSFRFLNFCLLFVFSIILHQNTNKL